MMTSAQVFELSVTTSDNSTSQDYAQLDNKTTLLHVTPGFKPFIKELLTFTVIGAPELHFISMKDSTRKKTLLCSVGTKQQN